MVDVAGEGALTVTVCWDGLGTAATCSNAFTLTVSSLVSCNASLCNSIKVVRSGNGVAGAASEVDGGIVGGGVC